MSRLLVAANVTHIEGGHVHEVLLAKLEFSTPVFVHTGFGTIAWDGNNYLGVGKFGGISAARESEHLGPSPLNLELSGIDATLLSESLNSGNYGDDITIYSGFRNDDGSLVGDPWIAWQGTLEFSQVARGVNNKINITCQHHLAILDQKAGGRFSDEDQRVRFTGDVGLEHAVDTEFVKLLWGRKIISGTAASPGQLPADEGDFHLR